jgi:hypothetical protein
VEVTPPSLAQDTIAHNARFRNSQERWANFNPDRARRLVALLRVADGCDLGVHRVPDAGAPKQAYLARAIQVRCRAARAAVHGSDLQQDMIHESLAAIHAVSQRARDVADIELRIANSTDTYSDLAARMLRELDRVSSVPAIRELAAYVTFAADQANFYAQHGAVADVRFDVQRAAPNATYRYEVSVVVVPSSKELLSQAVNSVHTDLARELSRGDRANDVRDCLLEAGLRFMDVRSAGFGQGKKEPLS